MLILLALACVGTPLDGPLPEGVYGSADLALRIDPDGSATFERSCWRGELGVVKATDGALVVDFDWERIGGDPEGVGETSPASLDATVTTTRLYGTLNNAGEVQDISLTWGEEPTYFECP